MIRDLAVIAPVVIGSLCLIAVCSVYVRSQSFRLDGALLAACGVALLGLSYWQAADSGEEDLALRLDALALLEGRIAEIADNQARLAEVIAAAEESPSEPPVEAPSATEEITVAPVAAESLAQVLEIEVLGGVSGDELAAIVEWVRAVRAEHRSSRIVVEPIMPLESADPGGQRRLLMNEAGRVIDHVFDELNQRVDIASLVSESVPGPRLRLAYSTS